MNAVVIRYCYPTSDMARDLGQPTRGGFYVSVGPFDYPISQLFQTIDGAEGFCTNHGLVAEPHKYPRTQRRLT